MNDKTNKALNRERTVFDLHPGNPSGTEKTIAEDSRLCPKCKRLAAGKKGGLVIACGQLYFHVDCYRCKRCENPLAIDNRIFLDFDGLPLCENCLHRCTACQEGIAGRVIYVSEGVYYHPGCFTCKKCSKLLDERQFAKTKKAMYCMDCHERRTTKIKRLTEKKTEMEKLAYGGLKSPQP